MVSVDHAVIARITSNGQHFEILVDCDNALALKSGKQVDMHDVLAVAHIYSDAKKSILVSEAALNAAFETTDVNEIATRIIQKGEVQLTAEYRQQLKDKKYRQIVNIIHQNGVDPKTHSPHPVNRIENALEEAKFHADEFTPVEHQVQEALKKLKPILPIKFEVKELEVKIGPQHAAKAYATIKHAGTILRETWRDDGYFVAIIEMPGGLEADFYDKINAICHGDVEVNVIKTK